MHDPSNDTCPRNADRRNECCACDPPQLLLALYTVRLSWRRRGVPQVYTVMARNESDAVDVLRADLPHLFALSEPESQVMRQHGRIVYHSAPRARNLKEAP